MSYFMMRIKQDPSYCDLTNCMLKPTTALKYFKSTAMSVAC